MLVGCFAFTFCNERCSLGQTSAPATLVSSLVNLRCICLSTFWKFDEPSQSGVLQLFFLVNDDYVNHL